MAVRDEFDPYHDNNMRFVPNDRRGTMVAAVLLGRILICGGARSALALAPICCRQQRQKHRPSRLVPSSSNVKGPFLGTKQSLVSSFHPVLMLRSERSGLLRMAAGGEEDVPTPKEIASIIKEESEGVAKKRGLPMVLDPGTKGGTLFLSLLLFLLPILLYDIVTTRFGVDANEAGRWIGVGFTLGAILLWVSTYIFRVATKDMTYAKQLRDYENAVIANRLEELDDDEVQALMEDIERDDF